MEQTAVVEDSMTTVKLVGDQDVARRRELQNRFEAVAAAAQFVTVDLTDVTYMDSSAISAIVALQRSMLQKSGRLRLLMRKNAAYRLMEIAGLVTVFETEIIE